MRKKNLPLTLFIMLLFFSLPIARVASVKQGTIVSIEPADVTVEEVDLPYTINVTITDADDLFGWELSLLYPTGILDPYPLINECFTEGPFLKDYATAEGGDTIFVFDNTSSTDEYNATHGLLHVGCSLFGIFTGANGTGVLATFNFTTIALGGPYAVALEETQFLDSNADDFYPDLVPGEVEVIPEFPLALILPLFMVATLAAVILGKAWLRKRRDPFVARRTCSHQYA